MAADSLISCHPSHFHLYCHHETTMKRGSFGLHALTMMYLLLPGLFVTYCCEDHHQEKQTTHFLALNTLFGVQVALVH